MRWKILVVTTLAVLAFGVKAFAQGETPCTIVYINGKACQVCNWPSGPQIDCYR
jgi:hypothetical protein